MLTPELVQRARAWTFDDALPFWLENSVDHRFGGFIETLDFNGQNANSPFKRVRVACRQVYVFSHAALLGWKDGLEAAEKGGRDLLSQCWRSDGAGFVRRLNPNGSVLDATIDLYDNAFALFGLSWLYRATGETWVRVAASRTLDAIQATLTHPGGQGYWHDEVRSGPRLQNPHMHLTEACLAAYQATGEGRYLEQAVAVGDLMRSRFFDGETLGEFFDDDWRRVAGDRGRIIEPGHQMEWAWILASLQQQAGADLSQTILKLASASEAIGVDGESGATFNVVRDDGAVLDGGSRTWPNTERLKAAVAVGEALGYDTRFQAGAATALLLDRYLVTPVRGGWIDAFDADGRATTDVMPTSTFYHVFLAFAELMRTERRLLAPSATQGPVSDGLGQ